MRATCESDVKKTELAGSSFNHTRPQLNEDFYSRTRERTENLLTRYFILYFRASRKTKQ